MAISRCTDVTVGRDKPPTPSGGGGREEGGPSLLGWREWGCALFMYGSLGWRTIYLDAYLAFVEAGVSVLPFYRVIA